jgi:transcriptional regulator with XRE-family HTH domain
LLLKAADATLNRLAAMDRLVCGRSPTEAEKERRLARSSKSGSPGSIPDPSQGRYSATQLKNIDLQVGARVRLRRIMLGMSQDAVSKIVGLTFQQLQKYEHGTNRISASRLYQLAQILHVPVSYFFEGVDADQNATIPPAGHEAPTSDQSGFPRDLLSRRETAAFVGAYDGIEDERQRQASLTLLKSLARSD